MTEVLAYLLIGTSVGFIIHAVLNRLSLSMRRILMSNQLDHFNKFPPYIYVVLVLIVGILAYDTGAALKRFFDYPFEFGRAIIYGPISEPWSLNAVNYARIVSRSYVALFAGIFCGILLSIFVDLSRSSERFDHRRSFSRMIGLSFVALFLFVLLSPFLERITASLTSVEVGQIGKFTFSNPQSSSTKGSTFTAGVGSSSAFTVRTNDVADWLGALKGLSNPSQNPEEKICLGTIQRDREYIKILTKEKSGNITTSNQNFEIELDQSVESAIKDEEDFFTSTSELPQCLGQYADNFSDYRLLLIDVKPIIHVFAAILTCHENRKSDKSANIRCPQDLLGLLAEQQSSKTFENARQSLNLMAAQIDLLGTNATNHCNQLLQFTKSNASKFIVLKETELPYKKVALSYLLTAVGASDTAAIELDTWVGNAAKKEKKTVADLWYIVRSKIEIVLILQKLVDNREQSSNYRNFVESVIKDFEMIFPRHDLEKWSKSCREGDDQYMKRIMFSSYITMLNEYFRSSADIENITQDILGKAKKLASVDMSCLSDVPSFEQQLEGWQANFMTTYASALVAASYSNRMFGKSPDKQRELQEEARRNLREALSLLERQDRTRKEEQRPLSTALCDKSSPRKSKLLEQWQWAGLRSNARSLLLRVGEGAD